MIIKKEVGVAPVEVRIPLFTRKMSGIHGVGLSFPSLYKQENIEVERIHTIYSHFNN